jgi:7-dehydrocholesterol reductase
MRSRSATSKRAKGGTTNSATALGEKSACRAGIIDWAAESFSGPLDRLLRVTVGPLLLLVITPVFVNIAALATLRFDGNVTQMLYNYDLLSGTFSIVSVRDLLFDAFPLPSISILALMAVFVLFELILFVLIPGKEYCGAVAPSGFIPRFRRNGASAFFITSAAFLWGSKVVQPPLFSAEVVYDNLLPIMTMLNVGALFIAVALFAKGVLSPSTPDHGHGSSVLSAPLRGLPFRLYWGEELYPSIFGVDLKHFLICRVGMMLWFIFSVSFAFAAVREVNGNVVPGDAVLSFIPTIFAGTSLIILYVAKFFVFFEVPGYMSAADISVDRLGFMLAWGPIVFMPLVHNLQVLHLVKGTTLLSFTFSSALAWVAFGIVMIFLNFDADTQRHRVRALEGKAVVWGKPATFIRATYTDAAGVQHSNLLLTCGWHGIVRHFHYIPDIILLAMYCFPAGLPWERPLVWMYFFYLSSLLIDRCDRIDARCAAKYGESWDAYRALVPYKLIPLFF